MPIQSGGRAPYAPPAAVLSFLTSYRNKPLPTPITNDVLVRAGISDSLAPRTLKSLEDLELIDASGMPTPTLEALRRVPEGEYRQRLGDIVRAVYAEVFHFIDPEKDDVARIADQFRVFEPIGQRTRMVTLFLGLCEAAGIVASSPKKPAPSTPRPTVAKARPTSSPPAGEAGRNSTRSNAHTGGGMPAAGMGAAPPAIAGLIASLPENGKGWTQAQRNRFLATFAAVLDFSIPIHDERPGGRSDDDADE